MYLIGHGYAPQFTVRGPNGVAYQEATPFIPANTNTMLSDGVVKAPSASLGFEGVFVPTAYMANGTTLESIFPAANNPEVSLIGYSGNLGLNSGQSQSVYQLDTSQMTEISGGPHLMTPGSTWKLPGKLGSITYDGTSQWVSLDDHLRPGADPGARLRHPGDRRAAAVVLRPAAAGVRPSGPGAGRRRLGRHGRRPDQDRCQRRVRG